MIFTVLIFLWCNEWNTNYLSQNGCFLCWHSQLSFVSVVHLSVYVLLDGLCDDGRCKDDGNMMTLLKLRKEEVTAVLGEKELVKDLLQICRELPAHVEGRKCWYTESESDVRNLVLEYRHSILSWNMFCNFLQNYIWYIDWRIAGPWFKWKEKCEALKRG